jgi:hypothetical protein
MVVQVVQVWLHLLQEVQSLTLAVAVVAQVAVRVRRAVQVVVVRVET